MANSVKTLHKAKKEKNDEFYTQLNDVNNELINYKDSFKDKIILCNCDDESSAFWEFFHKKFNDFKLKKLIATHYDKTKPTYKVEYTGGNDCDITDYVKTDFSGNGDFRNADNIKLLQESDIVVTNPPFSLFREYVAQLIEYDKKFIIIGNQNAITYKEIFPLLKDNKIWLGYGSNIPMVFKTPYPNTSESNKKAIVARGYNPNDGYIITPGVSWFTNIEHNKRHEKLILWKKYNTDEYPKYDNYDAIEVKKTDWIPEDYFDEMGVPITFMDKYCPEQFDIIKFRKGNDNKDLVYTINGKTVQPYFRIIIKRK